MATPTQRSAAALRKQIRSLVDRLEPGVAEAFAASVADMRDNVVLRRVVEALEAFNVDEAIRALNIEAAAYAPLRRALAQAYDDGGAATVAGLPRLRDAGGAQVVVRWNVANPRAEAEISRVAGEMITRAVPDQIEAARVVVLDGYSKGASK
jgi:hypothetical protein